MARLLRRIAAPTLPLATGHPPGPEAALRGLLARGLIAAEERDGTPVYVVTALGQRELAATKSTAGEERAGRDSRGLELVPPQRSGGSRGSELAD